MGRAPGLVSRKVGQIGYRRRCVAARQPRVRRGECSHCLWLQMIGHLHRPYRIRCCHCLWISVVRTGFCWLAVFGVGGYGQHTPLHHDKKSRSHAALARCGSWTGQRVGCCVHQHMLVAELWQLIWHHHLLHLCLLCATQRFLHAGQRCAKASPVKAGTLQVLRRVTLCLVSSEPARQ